MNKKIEKITRINSCNQPFKKAVMATFLVYLQLSACVAHKTKPLCNVLDSDESIDLAPLTDTLNEFQKMRHNGGVASTIGRLQNEYTQAVKDGNLEKVNSLVQNPSIDANRAGVYMHPHDFKKAESEWGIQNTKISGLKFQPSKLREKHYTKQDISDPYFCDINQSFLNDLACFDFAQFQHPVSSLALAGRCNHEKIFNFLLHHKNIDCVTPDPQTGCTPLHLALHFKWSASAKWLIKNLSVKDLLTQDTFNKATPLHIAIDCNFSFDPTNPLARNRLYLINPLLAKLPPAALALRDKNGDTPLHLAIKSGQKEIITNLVSKMEAKDLSIINNNEYTPLDLAIHLGRSDFVKILLGKLCLNQIFSGLEFALAYNDRKYQLLKRLLHQSADYIVPHLYNAVIKTSYANAIADQSLFLKQKLSKIIKILLTQGAFQPNGLDRPDSGYGSLLESAIQSPYMLTAVPLLIDKLPAEDLFYKDACHRTLLHLALMGRLPKKIIPSLIDKLSIKTLCAEDKHGITPLQLAMDHNDIYAVELLLKKLNPEALLVRDQKQRTVLEWVIRRKDLKTFQNCFNAIKNHFEDSFIVEQLFTSTRKGYSLLAAAFLSDYKSLKKLINNDYVQVPVAYSRGFQKFDYIIEAFSRSKWFTPDLYTMVEEEINSLEIAGIINKKYVVCLHAILRKYSSKES